MTPKLILTGFMATGKSVVGPLVARRLGWIFVDSDAEIVRRAGKPIADIFSAHGEAHFRTLEREVIAEIAGDLSQCPQCHGPRPAVIATGGGAIVDLGSCAALKSAGVIICLTARPQVIAARVERSRRKRPKLAESGKPVIERVRELMAERAEAYARVDVTIDTSDLAPEEAAEKVITEFAPRAVGRCRPSA